MWCSTGNQRFEPFANPLAERPAWKKTLDVLKVTDVLGLVEWPSVLPRAMSYLFDFGLVRGGLRRRRSIHGFVARDELVDGNLRGRKPAGEAGGKKVLRTRLLGDGKRQRGIGERPGRPEDETERAGRNATSGSDRAARDL